MFQKPVLFTVLILIVLTLFGSYWFLRPKDPISIGFVAGITGKYADLGVDCRRGVEIAIEQQNNAGGIHGHQVEMIAFDDQQRPETAISAVSSLLDRKVPVIIGHATSSMTMATLPLVNKSATIMLSPTSSTQRLKDIDDNFLRTCTVSSVSAAMMARYLSREKSIRHAGIIYDLGNSAYTQAWVDSFKDSFIDNQARSVVDMTFTSKDNVQLLPLVEQMRSKQIDVLVIVANSVDAAMISQQVRKSDWNVPLAMADWAATEQLIQLGGKAVEGVIIQQIFNRKSSDPNYLAFKHRFQELYKTEPGFGALHAYDAAQIAIQGLRQKKEQESLKEAILKIAEFQGLQFKIQFNKYGDSTHATYMGQVANGEFVINEEFH